MDPCSLLVISTSLFTTRTWKLAETEVNLFHSRFEVRGIVDSGIVDVTFDGDSTNLHAIWDTAMPEKYTGGYALTDAKTWATTLTTAIKTGTYKSSAAGWLTGMDITDPITSSLIWASDSNAYVCSTVLPDGLTAVEDVDLSGTYYNEALPVIKLQIAKAGYRYVTTMLWRKSILTAQRLGAWLNLIATGSTGL